ncbi:MAG: FHA domain-containing protein [Pirellulales bacterium]
MKVRLVTIDLWAPSVELTLSGSPLIIGSGDKADLRLEDRWTSAWHCEIAHADNVLTVRDLGSEHGTYVNGKLVESAPLETGDSLTVGIRTFRVTYRRARRAVPRSEPHFNHVASSGSLGSTNPASQVV